ncbi:plasmid mobilization protein [Paludibacterium yongneupense]|uniref:plasmid mobilization protein n=1 Tax=Paludibacterium yongneupense TaxID=400061 RepID=UPI001C05806E|nr:hypothetical protein [Paludibacterium yongneupense]
MMCHKSSTLLISSKTEGVSVRTHYLKTRLSPAENRALSRDADEAGLTVSEYVRTILMREREAVSIDRLVARLDQMLTEHATQGRGSEFSTSRGDAELLLVECVMLLRELSADRNAQILSRVSSVMDAKFGKDRAAIVKGVEIILRFMQPINYRFSPA